MSSGATFRTLTHNVSLMESLGEVARQLAGLDVVHSDVLGEFRRLIVAEPRCVCPSEVRQVRHEAG
jgi:hypothetical protein